MSNSRFQIADTNWFAARPFDRISASCKCGSSDRPIGEDAIGNPRYEILFVIDNLKPGGAQKTLLSLVGAINTSQVEPVVWCLGGTGPVEHSLSAAGVRVLRFNRFLIYSGIALLLMARHIRRHRVLLVQSFLFHSDVLSRILRKLTRVPAVVASVRSAEITKPGWKCWLNRRVATWADLTIAVSEDALEFAARREGLRREKAVIVMNAVDPASYDPGLRVSAQLLDAGIPPNARVVGTVGRLGPEKAHRSLLEAFVEVRRRVPDAHLVIAGDGPLRNGLVALAQRPGLADRAHVLGFREDVPRLLGAMDVFCLPSLFEGISNALLEAMAMARPCVATDVAGNKALIRDGVEGILVPPSDTKALAEAIVNLLEDRERATAMGAAARKRVEEEFTIDRMVKGYEAAYRAALEGKLEGASAPRIFREQREGVNR